VYTQSGGVSEWYAAGPLGVEQGFTLAKRPAGRSGALTVALAVSGLSARPAGSGVEFLARSGQVALRYGGLVAVDARGRQLQAGLSLSGGRLLLRVADRRAVYPVRIDPFFQQGSKLTPNDGVVGLLPGVNFGVSVALSADGKTALIGGSLDRDGVGAAWVFTRSGSTWTQQGPKLTANDETNSGEFGGSVALSADGNTALIGGDVDNPISATNNTDGVGAAWVFTRSGSTWTQQGPKLTANDETGMGQFGGSVALSPDGNTALIGGLHDNNRVGAAWVFTRSGSTWTQQGSKLTGAGETGTADFGSVALSADGSTALIGAPFDNNGVGAAWVFTRSGSTWTQQGSKLTANDETGAGGFGVGVALSADGSSALIGGPFDNPSTSASLPVGVGAAWAFTRSGSTWTQQGSKLTGTGEIGAGAFGSLTMSTDGRTALIGAPLDNNGVGAAWVFTRSGSTWTQQGSKLTANDETGAGFFGVPALSADGSTALISGQLDNGFQGAAWVFVVVGPPSASITSPAAGGVYTPGESVVTRFSCTDAVFGPGLFSCDDSTGILSTRGGTGRLDTATPGPHTYTVTATSDNGQTSTASIAYTVAPAPAIPSAPATPKVSIETGSASVAHGRATIRLSCSATPSYTCRGTLTLTIRKRIVTRAHHRRRVTYKTIVIARVGYKVQGAQTKSIALALTSAGKRLLRTARNHTLAVTATATLTGGKATTRTITLKAAPKRR
jgi:hypothetical protein